MEVRNKTVVVTGAATGIGRALALAFAQAGARGVAVADLNAAGAAAVAAEVQAAARACQVFTQPVDVADAAAVQGLADLATQRFGQVDIFCSNAGIILRKGLDASAGEWQRIWDINVMAHIHAAKAVLPQMLERGDGYFVNTVSAAGLLSQIGSAPYAVTKHAAIGFAEWLSITYGERGIKVSCICPQGVQTNMLFGENGERKGFLQEGSVTAGHVAAVTLEGVADERFLILPHPEVLEYYRRKGQDYDRWLRGMRRLHDKVMQEFGGIAV
ncbi:SDR family oxidoreductase [Cupriavidus taiwanensis]|uniref:SDR family oxidoreductase n=1 Tax=Cupriavidus taiwanensis TaxID=164546 RepID=UPI000E10B465|nr:SDR family oxidoreductase [Cupriavidus taiwanensis]SOY66658.1 putative NAD(P)-dependent oxidoreductase; Short-chain dehydrogenase/reductase (SDR) family [Cupriavidus taiwanensis]SOY66719.1 putative NAD(P)-dependent oxidoreductase; Short-chain dehydrogenase/reductase (SDR) family [Cupriavidus taiwanensis]SOY94748.1 putative NAD(P)-dependent oxidoreductase; Short-chain dehydrogenase/reductase (SDR) family [Cupriavidus taiwanensis]SOZ71518.1 putative NAD(P)-dependent oxidoreductase; Short-chain